MDDSKLAIYQSNTVVIESPVDATSETIWASQKQIAEVFSFDVRTVNEHLQNIFKTDDLTEDSVVRNFRTTASDGKKYDTKHYNLDVESNLSDKDKIVGLVLVLLGVETKDE